MGNPYAIDWSPIIATNGQEIRNVTTTASNPVNSGSYDRALVFVEKDPTNTTDIVARISYINGTPEIPVYDGDVFALPTKASIAAFRMRGTETGKTVRFIIQYFNN